MLVPQEGHLFPLMEQESRAVADSSLPVLPFLLFFLNCQPVIHGEVGKAWHLMATNTPWAI